MMDHFMGKSVPSRTPLAATSTNRKMGLQERPSKRLKVVKDSESDSDSHSTVDRRGGHSPAKMPKFEDHSGPVSGGDDTNGNARGTAFDGLLPSIDTDAAAIEEYEVMRASQVEPGKADNASVRLDSRQWIRGKSSIYVDAFNLALDTVLEDEAHLFDDRERAVFREWMALSYEAQYLYVRLFLRKTAAWHRIERLGYYQDISDPKIAIEQLQELRDLPDNLPEDDEEHEAMQDWDLVSPFAFADSSSRSLTTIEEAAALLSLDELKALAKETRVVGKNKGELLKAFCRMSTQQVGLLSVGLRRSSTIDSTASLTTTGDPEDGQETTPKANRFLDKVLAITGPCIRISESVFKLFERVHMVFYRSTEWTEKSLTTIILAKCARRNFPEYIVDRSSNVFPSRFQLLEFEQAMRKEFEVDQILEFNGPPGEAGFRRVLEIFDAIEPRLRAIMQEEQRKEDHIYQFNEGSYLRRFCAAHPYTRIAHKAGYVMGRLHDYRREHALLTELLDQRLFHLAKRGGWYQRKALLEEHYMWEASEKPGLEGNSEQLKQHWRRVAVATCEAALEDADCHLIFHYDLQKRLMKLEKRLRIPRRLQHDFGHVILRKPEEHYVEGTQLKKEDPPARLVRTTSNGSAAPAPARGPSTKTVWVDEAEGGGECSVEAMCLSWYRARGWKGYHAEGGIVRTLFAYLFFDILFLYVPGVFQTAFQTGPLDLHGDGFYPARASEINHRLVELANGGAADIVRRIDEQHRERRTCVVGLNWDYELEDILELVSCFEGAALAAVCKVMAQEYKQRGGGVPDLLLWRTTPEERTDGDAAADEKQQAEQKGQIMFAEVKSANDRLSDTQRLWIHVLTGAGVRVALCNAVAKEVRTVP
jgi:fanconi-associated nuclease 1